MSLYTWLVAEKDFPGLWPHRGTAERGRAESVLHVAGLDPDDTSPMRPSVQVRQVVAAWQGARQVHAWIDAKAGPIGDGDAKWLDRELLDELLDYAGRQLAVDDDADGNWAATVLQLSRVLANPRLMGAGFYYEASM